MENQNMESEAAIDKKPEHGIMNSHSWEAELGNKE